MNEEQSLALMSAIGTDLEKSLKEKFDKTQTQTKEKVESSLSEGGDEDTKKNEDMFSGSGPVSKELKGINDISYFF